MGIERRGFLRLIAGAASLGAAMVSGLPVLAGGKRLSGIARSSELSPMTGDVAPISLQERLSRIDKAQRLMAENNIAALMLDSGTSMVYFTGINWWPSERTMVAIIPARGEVTYICPAFEAERLRQLISIGAEVRIWEEDESPYRQIANAFRDFNNRTGNIGIEERLRFFIFDGVRKEASHLTYISGDPVTMRCRLIKSPAEISLMQKASDITIAAYKAAVALLHEGMTPADFAAIAGDAHSRRGAKGGLDANFGEASSYPHGSINPQHLKKGDVVIMDGGCKVEGYQSDISRTVVFGATPTARQREIWDLEKAAHDAAFSAAQVGIPCEEIDRAARKVLTDAGFGPGFKVPGCPHRTGHGIGMDMHEWGNIVPGNKQPLQVGMCFSIEPMIAIYGEFGVRLEDCVYMTEEGPRWFSQPSAAIDRPFSV